MRDDSARLLTKLAPPNVGPETMSGLFAVQNADDVEVLLEVLREVLAFPGPRQSPCKEREETKHRALL